MQPSDSLASFSRGFGSPRRRPTSWGRRLFCRLTRRPVRAPADAPASENGSPALHPTGNSRGEVRASRVTGPSSSRVPWCNTPPDTAPPRPYFSSRRSTERSPSPSRKKERSASGDDIVFEATYPRPTRSRTYASTIPLPRPSQGSLPARAGSPLAGRASHPLDDERNFMESSHPPIPIDQQSLVALNCLSLLHSSAGLTFLGYEPRVAWEQWVHHEGSRASLSSLQIVQLPAIEFVQSGKC